MSGRFVACTALVIALIAALATSACGGDDGQPGATPTTSATAAATTDPTATATPTATHVATAAPSQTFVPGTASDGPLPSPTPRPPAIEPTGFPLDPATVLGVVVGPVGARQVAWDEGPAALDYSRDQQPSDDPVQANAAGWNCRLHVEYEGSPAADWYIPEGTPITATMDGTATLYVITVSNAFDAYEANREPYVGDPDRANAPLSPFPGPGGGKGVFVRIENAEFVTEYAHLALAETLGLVPGDAFIDGFSAGYDYASAFTAMRGYLDITPIAAWEVSAGDLVGYSGDAGYSEAPHLHYTVARQGGGLLCPTTEAGFEDGGWLFR